MTWHGKKVLQGVNPWLRLPCLRNVKLNITTKLGAQIIHTDLRSTYGEKVNFEMGFVNGFVQNVG